MFKHGKLIAFHVFKQPYIPAFQPLPQKTDVAVESQLRLLVIIIAVRDIYFEYLVIALE
jgi:hypothetical protein